MAESTLSTTSCVSPSNSTAGGPRAVSPAAHLADRFAAAEVTGPRAVRIREIGFVSMVGIRVVSGSTAARRIEARLDTGLPTCRGSVTTAGGIAVLWMSPDEFLVVTGQPAGPLTAMLRDTLRGESGAVIDLSANRTTLELAGPSARAVLEKGCPLDLHPRAFEVGTALVTMIGSVPVVVWKVDDEIYRVLPRSSFADHLGRWMLDAVAEFSVPEIPVTADPGAVRTPSIQPC
jgi:sarcosine oxidase, subunit gamma